jgi:hypothetical protein
MSLVKVPLHGCSLCAVAELREVFNRMVARLPDGIVPALAPNADVIKSIASVMNLLTFISLSSCRAVTRNSFLPWV